MEPRTKLWSSSDEEGRGQEGRLKRNCQKTRSVILLKCRKERVSRRWCWMMLRVQIRCEHWIWYQGLLSKAVCPGTSLVAQWLRICLPRQGTRVRSLVREDPTCRGATKPVHHNYWACALEPASHNYWACMPHLLKPARLEPVLHNKRSHHNEKPAHRNEE